MTHELTNKRFLSLADRKVIRYENVVKAIYYLLEFDKQDICLPETQKLFWKIAKKHWSKDLLDKMVAFVYTNAKGHELKSYQTLDFVQGLLGEITFEELSQYNYSLAMILKWIKLAIEARRRDIGKRSNEKKVLREERDAKIEEEKERVERRTKDVEEQKEQFMADHGDAIDRYDAWKKGDLTLDDGEEEPEEIFFDEAGIVSFFDSENPAVKIPPEVVEDQDNDWVLDAEKREEVITEFLAAQEEAKVALAPPAPEDPKKKK